MRSDPALGAGLRKRAGLRLRAEMSWTVLLVEPAAAGEDLATDHLACGNGLNEHAQGEIGCADVSGYTRVDVAADGTPSVPATFN